MTDDELDAHAAQVAAEAPPIPPESWAVVLAVMGPITPQRAKRPKTRAKAA